MSLDILLSASLAQGNITFLEKFPKFTLSKAERAAISWVVSYFRKFEKVPAVERFKASPHGDMYTKRFLDSPLEDLFEEAIKKKKEQLFYEAMRGIEEEIEGGSDVPVAKIAELYRNLSSISAEDHESIFEVDRDRMYSEEPPEGLKFGFNIIDESTGGLLNGEYGLLVARPGVGKTMLLCKLAVDWLKLGKRLLFVSCEMPVSQIVARMDGMLAHFNPKILRTKKDVETLAAKKIEVKERLEEIRKSGGEVIFSKTRRMTPTGLAGLVRDLKPDVVIVDGIYLMRSDDGATVADWQKIKAISNELKQIALENDIPVFGTSQLKRTGKEDGASLDDIAYSDAFSQDTDLVLSAQKSTGMRSEMMLDVIKNRNGDGPASIVVKWDYARMEAREASWEDSSWGDEE